jgi:hypothetical protein
VHDHRVLLLLVVGVGEHVRHQAIGAELGQCPVERVDAGQAAGDIRGSRGVAGAGRGIDGHVRERAGREAELRIRGDRRLVQPGVRVVEEQQILALHIEDQRLRVGRFATEHARPERAVEQERREARLGGHAGDAGDRHVRAARTIEKLRVEIERLAVAAGADRDALVHPVEVEGGVPLVAGGPVDKSSGGRRDVHLGLDPGGGDLGRLLDLRGQRTFGDREHVGLEFGALVPSADLGDDAGDRDRLPTRHIAMGDDDVVELQIGPGCHGHPELQRRRVRRAQHTPHGLVHARAPRSFVRTRAIVPHRGDRGTMRSRASGVRFVRRVAVFGPKPQIHRYGLATAGLVVRNCTGLGLVATSASASARDLGSPRPRPQLHGTWARWAPNDAQLPCNRGTHMWMNVRCHPGSWCVADTIAPPKHQVPQVDTFAQPREPVALRKASAISATASSSPDATATTRRLTVYQNVI